MTGDYTTGARPPDHWRQLCRDSGALFGSTEWQQVLEDAFNCRSVYFSNDAGGLVVSIFPAGPFRIGYLGFPAGAVVGRVDPDVDLSALLASADGKNKPTCVRVPVSAFNPALRAAGNGVQNPETVIESLGDWGLDRVSKKLRRDVRRSQRAGLQTEVSADPADGRRLFEIYAGTVVRRGGALRYNERYFRSLIGLSMATSQIRVSLATRSGTIAGFVVTAVHADTAYYLHGGVVPEFRKESPSDLLLYEAIVEAQRQGCRKFNLMASPPGQPTLVRYKEKWGGVTRNLETRTIGLRPGYALFRIAEWALHRFRRG